MVWITLVSQTRGSKPSLPPDSITAMAFFMSSEVPNKLWMCLPVYSLTRTLFLDHKHLSWLAVPH